MGSKIVSVLGNVSRVSDGSGKPDNDVQKSHKSQKKIDVIKGIDYVPSNVQSSRQEALLYVFEDSATMDPALIDWRNLIDGDWANFSWNDSQQ